MTAKRGGDNNKSGSTPAKGRPKKSAAPPPPAVPTALSDTEQIMMEFSRMLGKVKELQSQCVKHKAQIHSQSHILDTLNLILPSITTNLQALHEGLQPVPPPPSPPPKPNSSIPKPSSSSDDSDSDSDSDSSSD